MKAKVFYIYLTRKMVDDINADGWDSPLGGSYLAAKKGDRSLAPVQMIQLAAEVQADDAEDIWIALQNGVGAKSKAEIINRTEAGQRSMDIGDFIEWEDGKIERCDSIGFKMELESQVAL